MKDKREISLSTRILQNTQTTTKLLKEIKNLTVEDVVVIYAYAEAIVETVREPLVILDNKLRIKTANKSFFDTFMVTKDNTYNRLIFDIGNKQWDIPELKKLLKEILPKNSYFNNFEVHHNFESIGEKTMLLNARRIVLEGHRTELILLAIEDITEKKLLDSHKDDFIGIVSHELKTPLSSIKAFVQVLSSHNKSTQDTKDIYILDKISAQVEKMEHMLSTFLNAYTLQARKLELHNSHFFLNDLVHDIVETLRYSAPHHTIINKTKTDHKIFADKERIGQVLNNLLTNAIKYSPKAHKVIVEAEENGKELIVKVQDFGPGIPKEQQRIIFERFFRAKVQKKRNVEGLGLGLYIAYEIIREHKGRMWVESKAGKGSIFYFTLPLHPKKRPL